MVWDGRSPDSPVHTLSAHQAAVKAISWCPWQPKTLASGGGTNDREIRFWNSATGICINSVDTGKSEIQYYLKIRSMSISIFCFIVIL